LRSIVNIVWTLSRLEFQPSEEVLEALLELRQYERLQEGLESMYQKNQCILLWTYSRDIRLVNKEFLSKLVEAMLSF